MASTADRIMTIMFIILDQCIRAVPVAEVLNANMSIVIGICNRMTDNAMAIGIHRTIIDLIATTIVTHRIDTKVSDQVAMDSTIATETIIIQTIIAVMDTTIVIQHFTIRFVRAEVVTMVDTTVMLRYAILYRQNYQFYHLISDRMANRGYSYGGGGSDGYNQMRPMSGYNNRDRYGGGGSTGGGYSGYYDNRHSDDRYYADRNQGYRGGYDDRGFRPWDQTNRFVCFSIYSFLLLKQSIKCQINWRSTTVWFHVLVMLLIGF